MSNSIYNKPMLDNPTDYGTTPDAYRINFKLNTEDIEKIQDKPKSAQLTTNGTILYFKREFEVKYNNMKQIDTDKLYDQLIKDISVLPYDNTIKDYVNGKYDQLFKQNLNAIYTSAAGAFKALFDDKALYEIYQLRFYLLVLINCVNNNSDELSTSKNISKYVEWVRPRLDPNIPYYIAGPKDNQEFNVISSEQHYKTLINPTTSLSAINDYLQLSTQQTISDNTIRLYDFLRAMPNVFTKNPNEQCKYLLSIDSANDVLVNIDNDNNLVFNCANVKIGDVDDTGSASRIDDIVVNTGTVNELTNSTLRALRELFNAYGRIKVKELVIKENTYISSLTAFDRCFLIFEGITCSERSVYNNASAAYFMIGGHFTKTSRGYEFIQDSDAITYKPSRVDIKHFKLYIAAFDGAGKNLIIPNDYTIDVPKNKIYQHPIATNVTYSSKDYAQTRIDSYAYYDVADDNNIANNTVDLVSTDQINEILSTVKSMFIATPCSQQFITSFSLSQANINVLVKHLQMVNDCVDICTYHYKTTTDYRRTPFTYVSNYIKAIIKQLRSVTIKTPISTIDSIMTKVKSYDQNKMQALLNFMTQTLYIPRDFASNTELKPDTDVNTLKQQLIDNGTQYINPPFSNTTKYFTIVNDMTIAKVNDVVTNLNALFRSIDTSVNCNFNELNDHLICWIMTLNIMTSCVNFNVFSPADYKVVTEQKIVDIDTTTGTINGKYFRMNANGIPVFNDEDGNPYTTPDEQYLMYTYIDDNNRTSAIAASNGNDILLYNLYKYNGNNIIEAIDNGSFLYSERLGTMQNLSYSMTNYSNTYNKIKFDNVYNYGMYNIVPNSYNRGNNGLMLYWSDLSNIYSNDVLTYYKKIEVDNTLGTNITSYYAINNKNNTIIPSIEASHVIGIYDVNNGIYKDCYYLPREDIPGDAITITIEDLFNNNTQVRLVQGTSIKQVSHNMIYTSNIATGSVTVYEGLLNAIVNEHLYYYYHDIIKRIIHSDDYFNIYTDLNDNPTNSNANYVLETIGISLKLPNRDYLLTNTIAYIDNVEFVNIMTNRRVYFNGFVRYNGNNNYTLTGVCYDDNEDTYMMSVTATSTSVVDPSVLNTFIKLQDQLLMQSAYSDIKVISIDDYFGQTLTIGSTITHTALTQEQSITDLDGLSYTSQDQDNNTITLTYKVLQYKSITNIIITTVKRNITTGQELSYVINVYSDTASGMRQVTYNNICYITSYIDTEGVHKLIYNITDMYAKQIPNEDVTIDMSNAYKAYNVSGYDFINMYWNKDSYIYSLMHALLPIDTTLSEVPLAYNIEYTNDDGTEVYTYDSISKAITLLNGTYTITNNAILHDALGKAVKNLYVYQHHQLNATIDPNYDLTAYIPVGVQGTSIKLMDEDGTHKFTITMQLVDGVVKGYTLTLFNTYYNPDSSALYYNKGIQLNSYDDDVISDVITYVGDYKVLITYTYDSTLGYLFSDIVVTKTFNNIIYYSYDAAKNKVYMINMPHIEYTNIPGEPIPTANELLTLSPSVTSYRLHPCIAYFENSFVSPKYINTNGQYISLFNIFNQNTLTSQCQLKSYNTLLTDASNSIAPLIPALQTHVVESLDNYMLMVSDLDKRQNNLVNTAIRSEHVFMQPKTTRLTLTLEFS